MDTQNQLARVKANIKMRTEHIAQLKYSIALLRISIAGLEAKLGMYRCSKPQLIARGNSYSSSSSDSDNDLFWGLLD